MKILKFYTECCAQCKQQSKLLEGLKGVEIIPVDCEYDTELSGKYQVRSLPTMVLLDDNDKLVSKFIGITPIVTIQNAIQDYIKEPVEAENTQVSDNGLFYKQ